MTTRSLSAAVLALLLLAGCGAPVALRTQPAPISACMDALATGVLVSSNLSGLAIRTGEGTITEVEWPFEYTARHDGVGLVLVDGAGKAVAREGQLIQMGGGGGANGVWHACPGSISVVPAPEN